MNPLPSNNESFSYIFQLGRAQKVIWHLSNDSLVLSIHVSHFSLRHTISHPGSILIGTDVLGQFRHVGLAKTLEFSFRLVEWIKVGSTDGSPRGKSRDGIGKDLFKSKAMDYRLRHVGSKVKRTAVGSQGRRILNPPSTV